MQHKKLEEIFVKVFFKLFVSLQDEEEEIKLEINVLKRVSDLITFFRWIDILKRWVVNGVH